jgi:dCTP deaminase
VIVNYTDLIAAKPVSPMFLTKQKANGVSFGMSEAGYDIRIKQTVLLHPLRRFTLASAIERFDMPDNLVGIVHDKSTWARRGLSVFNTVIESGWKGFLTLELIYHGWKPLRIKAGSGIAQVIFHEVTCPVTYTGRYQDQPDMPVAAKELK